MRLVTKYDFWTNLLTKANISGFGGGPPPEDIDKFLAGNSLTVEMQNIDPAVYQYYLTLNQILQKNPAFGVTPANPTSNFSGGALGYFNTHSKRVRRIKIP